MSLDRHRVAGKGELYDMKPFILIIKICEGVTHTSIECLEEATWKGPDWDSQRWTT